MITVKFVRLAIIILFLPGCSADKNKSARTNGFSVVLETKEDSLFHEVMNGHDSAMAKLGKLRRYKVELQTAIDSIKPIRQNNGSMSYKKDLSEIYHDLLKAEEGMNLWMDGFNPDSAKENKQQRINYLESEKIKVEKIKNQILNALQRADSVILQLK